MKFNMASNLAKGKGTGKGKRLIGISSWEPESVFDLVDESNVDFFDKKCRERNVSTQSFYKVATAEELHILEVVTWINHQGINLFLQLTQ